jgi:hypothetical protein
VTGCKNWYLLHVDCERRDAMDRAVATSTRELPGVNVGVLSEIYADLFD